MGAPIRRYYTPYEVAKHNLPDDCWVSFLGGVYDITKLLKVSRERASQCTRSASPVVFTHSSCGLRPARRRRTIQASLSSL
eukprot:363374-Chlamydomonas_euryale.AAC.7